MSLHTFQQNTPHCIASSTGLTEDIFTWVLKERKPPQFNLISRQAQKNWEVQNKRIFTSDKACGTHLLPPNLSIILVDNIIFRNLDGFLYWNVSTYLNRYFYRHLDQIFLFNSVIKPHYQETKTKSHQAKKQRLVDKPEQCTCLSLPPESTSCGNYRPLWNKNINPFTWQLNAARKKKKKKKYV